MMPVIISTASSACIQRVNEFIAGAAAFQSKISRVKSEFASRSV
jgi:hypothetical protein